MKLIKAEVVEHEPARSVREYDYTDQYMRVIPGRYRADLTYRVHVLDPYVEPDDGMIGRSGPRLVDEEWTDRGLAESEEGARQAARWAIERAEKEAR